MIFTLLLFTILSIDSWRILEMFKDVSPGQLSEFSDSACAIKWKNCQENELFNVSSVVIDPYPVIPGEQVTITSTGVQTETVTGGNWTAYIAYRSFKLQYLSGEVCGLAPKCPCPCSDKQVTTVLKAHVNNLAFHGTYNGKFTSFDQNGKSLSCVTFEFEIK